MLLADWRCLIFLQVVEYFWQCECMDYYRNWRTDYPHLHFETRALPEFDGVTHLITLENWYWETLKIYVSETSETIEGITRFCLDYARMKQEKDNLDFGKIFYEAFTYYIYSGYSKIYKTHKNIANDFWE